MTVTPPAPGYARWTREPVIYFEVLLGGRPIGRLWASREHPAAGFLCDPAAPEAPAAAEVWEDRLAEAHGRREPAVEAVRRCRGTAEQPGRGGVPANAVEQAAPSLAALYELAEPGVPAPQGPLVQDGRFPDGTPADRSLGSAAPYSVLPASYPVTASGPVTCLPVTRRNALLGYVWASQDGRSAGYLPCAAAGRDGEIAAGLWKLWLSRSYQARLSSVDALRRCAAAPADELAGYVGRDAAERALPDLDALRRLARG
ncbi:hypothetical protein [Actinomadura sp. 21ATH]|uniref:hypothetical protein n=1 Tax=Actinomadura sp. 21ATH TaxID=1735444 RepID=UPI0035C1C17A